MSPPASHQLFSNSTRWAVQHVCPGCGEQELAVCTQLLETRLQLVVIVLQCTHGEWTLRPTTRKIGSAAAVVWNRSRC